MGFRRATALPSGGWWSLRGFLVTVKLPLHLLREQRKFKTTGPFEMLILIHCAPFHHRQFRMSSMSVFLFWIPKAWEEGKLTEEKCKCGNFYW